MNMAKSLKSYLHFFLAGLKHHSQTGAIVPSQRILVDKMIDPIPVDYSGQIVELGAGNGALTVRLAQTRPKARILACEINPVLAADLRAHLDRAGINGRVEVVSAPAETVLTRFHGNGSSRPDFVVSGIPLYNVGEDETVALIRQINVALRESGMYIQFQHSLADRKKIKATFARLRTVPVLLNFPPAFVYYATK
jgi:phosphatidylethanolamine/phosphatidyl-N-methylethanolamine N-methyltransferase